MTLVRAGKRIQPATPAAFLRFSQVLAAENRAQALLDCHELSCSRPVIRVDFARCSAGHEVHVITLSDDGTYRLDMEEGVWIHRLAAPRRWCPEVEGQPGELLLKRISASYHEFCKIQDAGTVDLVAAPARDVLGSLCQFDDRFPMVQSSRSWNDNGRLPKTTFER